MRKIICLVLAGIFLCGQMPSIASQYLAPSSHTEEAWIVMQAQALQNKDENQIREILEKCTDTQLGALVFGDAPGLNNTIRQIALHVLASREDSDEIGRRFAQKAEELLPQGVKGLEALKAYVRLPLYWKYVPRHPNMLELMFGGGASFDMMRLSALDRMRVALLLAVYPKFKQELRDKETRNIFSHLGIAHFRISDWFHKNILVDTILREGQLPHAATKQDETMLQGAVKVLILLHVLKGTDYPLGEDATGIAVGLNSMLRESLEALNGNDQDDWKTVLENNRRWTSMGELLDQAMQEGIIRVSVSEYWQEALHAKNVLEALLPDAPPPISPRMLGAKRVRLGVVRGSPSQTILPEAKQDEIQKQRAALLENLTMLAWTLAIGYHHHVRFPPQISQVSEKDMRNADLRARFDAHVRASEYAQAIALGMELIEQGDRNEKFMNAMAQCLVEHPADPETMKKVALYLFDEWRLPEAEKLLKLGLEKYPDNNELKDVMVHLLHRDHRLDEAISMATDLLRKDPTRFSTWHQLLNIFQGKGQQQRYWDTLAESLRQPIGDEEWSIFMGIAENAALPHGYYDLFEIEKYSPEDPRFQKAGMEETAKRNPYSHDQKYYGSPAGREAALREIGLWDRRSLFAPLEIKPEQEILDRHKQEAQSAFHRGDFPKAMEIYKSILTMDRDNVPALRGLAKTYVGMQQQDLLPLASAALTHALLMDPRNADILEAKAQVRLGLGDMREAAIYFYETLEFDENRVSALRSLLEIRKSQARYKEALRLAGRILSVAEEPNIQTAMFRVIAELYQAQGKKSLAAKANRFAGALPQDAAAKQRSLAQLRLLETGQLLKHDFTPTTIQPLDISL